MGAKRRALAVEVGGRLSTAVSVQAVPEQEDRAADVAPQVSQKPNHLGGAHDIRMQREVQACRRGSTAARGPVGEGPDRRQALPGAMAMNQDRRLPARRPGPADSGPLREAALVEEHDRSVSAGGVFFNAGQVSRTQRRIARSSRSRARVVGF